MRAVAVVPDVCDWNHCPGPLTQDSQDHRWYCKDHATPSLRFASWSNKPALVASKPGIFAPSGAEITDMDIAPIRWVVEGILPEGTCLFSGKPKAGKSFLALALVLAVEKGSTVLNLQADKGEALYVALEDGYRRIQTRLRGAKPAGAYFPIAWPRLNEGGIEELDKWLTAHSRAHLVVIDTLQLIRPRQTRGANPYAEDYEAMAMLGELGRRHPGVAVVIVHHNRKMAADDPFDMASGTNGLPGSADSLWVLIKDGGQNILHVKSRDFTEQAMALTQDLRGQWHSAGAPGEYRNAPQLAATLTLVVESTSGVTAPDLAAHLGITPQLAGQRLLRLVEDGHAERVGVRPVRYFKATPSLELVEHNQ